MLDDQRDVYQRALEGAAQLVALYGDEFLPAFIRIEEELEALDGQSSAAVRAKELAKRSSHAA